MKNPITILSDSFAHSPSNHEKTQAAVKEAKRILLAGEGTREEREELLDTLLTFKWIEGGNDHQDQG